MELNEAMSIVAKHDAALKAAPSPSGAEEEPGPDAIQMVAITVLTVLGMVAMFAGLMTYSMTFDELGMVGAILAGLIPMAIYAVVSVILIVGIVAIGTAIGIRREHKGTSRRIQREMDQRARTEKHVAAREAAEKELSGLFKGTDYTYEMSDNGVKLVKK